MSIQNRSYPAATQMMIQAVIEQVPEAVLLLKEYKDHPTIVNTSPANRPLANVLTNAVLSKGQTQLIEAYFDQNMMGHPKGLPQITLVDSFYLSVSEDSAWYFARYLFDYVGTALEAKGRSRTATELSASYHRYNAAQALTAAGWLPSFAPGFKAHLDEPFKEIHELGKTLSAGKRIELITKKLLLDPFHNEDPSIETRDRA